MRLRKQAGRGDVALSYWQTPAHALRLAQGRLEMLLDADLPDSDHPGATRYVLGVVQAALAGIETGTAETCNRLGPEGMKAR